MNKQPFYHSLPVLFTATQDLSNQASSAAFRKRLATFLRKELGSSVIASSVQLDGECDAEAGNPPDLM